MEGLYNVCEWANNVRGREIRGAKWEKRMLIAKVGFFCRRIHFVRKVSRRLKTENDPFLSAFFVLYGNF